MSPTIKIRQRDRDAILQSLRAGVVPRRGQHLIQVGREMELKELISDLERIADGGSSFRLVIGDYGAGKTFFLNLVRSVAMEKRMVTAHADLNPDRRLHATGGQARSLYQELMRNLSTRTRPDGGALPGVLERFVSSAIQEASTKGLTTEAVIRERLSQLTELVGGYDFAEVLVAYWRGHDTGDETLKANATRWMRGEFSTKTDARSALGVRTIVDDASLYDQLKLLGRFIRLSGYDGLVVCLDELVNLYKLSNTRARNSNYEALLRILNDCLQGTAEGLGFILGGTPEFLMDTRRGLYSYEALQSRLAENRFAAGELVDLSGPVIRLSSLTPEDLFVLLDRLCLVQGTGDRAAVSVNQEGIKAFLVHCSKGIGEAYFRTPRNTIKAFVDLLAVLEQNPRLHWTDLIQKIEVEPDMEPDGGLTLDDGEDEDDELSSFRL